MSSGDHRRSQCRGGTSPLEPAPRIIAVQGAAGGTIQDLLATLARRWTAAGRRVVGVIEETAEGVPKRNGAATLRNLRTGALYDIYQDLGPLSQACCLDARGFAEACQNVVDDLADADVVVLSKFGKLEAERGGLLAAFTAAASLEKPVITAVSPVFSDCYLAFVGPFGAIVPPDEESLHTWGQAPLLPAALRASPDARTVLP
ncbi:MAG: DUF2478 domain-containing protein [Hyphomicrobium sp.]|nr:DUF2478 domain-containing protein [Hyphomicrobium sp.]